MGEKTNSTKPSWRSGPFYILRHSRAEDVPERMLGPRHRAQDVACVGRPVNTSIGALDNTSRCDCNARGTAEPTHIGRANLEI